MIQRLKGVIAHSHNTKLPGEDGEGVAAGWGTRPSPKAKPFEENPKDTLTCGWGNRPNPKKESHVRQRGGQNRPGRMYTHSTADGDQTRCHGTWQTDILMAIGVQQTGDRSVAT